jgi:hypothetical protein
MVPGPRGESMKHQYQKQLHKKTVAQSLKIYAYYLEHKDTDSNYDIARHFGHSLEWLRQMRFRAEEYYAQHPA